ncbi:MAG: sulfite exporter TauE/SafE family protein, partial [Bacteroidetes bacterium]|nr:sulfite exporter TauE/SafE family protein [Bacteroidota bacterium]
NNTFTKLTGALTYNIGKVLTYALLGLLFGLFGKGLVLAGFQQWISIVLGAIMILSVFFPVLFKNKVFIDKFVSSFASRMISKLRSLFAISSYKSLFLIGFFNGLLPCGLVYIAIAGAIESKDALSGAIYMAAFGLGTAPMLIGIAFLSSTLNMKIRAKLNKLIPILVILIGLLFILRGLNLGIPYISPKDQVLSPQENVDGESSEHSCH